MVSYPGKNFSAPFCLRRPVLWVGALAVAASVSGCTRGTEQSGSGPVSAAPSERQEMPLSAGNSAHPLWTNYEINSSVHALAFRGGEVWVGTEGGLLRYDLAQDAVVAKYDTTSGLLSNNVVALQTAPDGGMWVGTHGGGLIHISTDGRWTRHSVPDLGDPFVYQVLADVKGNGYWVATWSGLSHFDGTAWRTFTKADGLVDDWVYAMAQDSDGTLWLGTEGGVSVFDGAAWRTYTHDDGLGADTARIGDYEVIGNPSLHHRNTPGKSAEGYNPNYVLSALIDTRGNKWFGTWGAGLSRFDGGSWASFTRHDGLGGNYVTDLKEDRDGAIWATTDGGVSVYREGAWHNFNSRDGLISDSVFAVALDDRGRQWFGTMGGISRLDGWGASPSGSPGEAL